MKVKKDVDQSNPLKMAAAIKYEGNADLAPRITAKGKGIVAEKIIEMAARNNIPIKDDPGLVQILCKLDLDEQIPEPLYKAVAEILAYIYSLNSKLREKNAALPQEKFS